MKTSRLAANSILAAACTILGYFALDLGNIKISFEALPIFIAACLFGAYDAALVSLVARVSINCCAMGLQLRHLLDTSIFALQFL